MAPGGQRRCDDPHVAAGGAIARSRGARCNSGFVCDREEWKRGFASETLGQSISVLQQDSCKQQAGTVGVSRNPGVVDEMYQKLRGDSWKLRPIPAGQGMRGPAAPS